MITAALGYLGRHATRMLAFGVVLGLAVPPLSALVHPLLAPLLLPPLTIALIRLDWRGFVPYLRRPVALIVLMAWLLVASPLAVSFLLRLVPIDPAQSTAVILMAAAPPIMSCAALALILRLDASLAVIGSVLATAIVPFTLPPIALNLVGLDLEIGVGALMLRLLGIVGFAFVGSLVIRRLVRQQWLAENARTLDGVSVLSLWLFALAIMDGVTAIGLDRPGFFLGTLALAFAANLGLQALGFLIALPLGRIPALTVGLMTGNCNMGLVLVVLADKAHPDVAAYFALAQLPMFMLPALINPLYRRLARNEREE
jgi:BASS family bile acid:Na+ symporter